jgi:cyclopropane fatty-acyl-phospholipid synthase-like methyltransferase
MPLKRLRDNGDMDNYAETVDTWNKVASLYREKFMDLDIYNSSYDLFCNSIRITNSQILEIGCGPGNITRYLMARRPDLTILATDVSRNMIALAREALPLVDFRELDCREISVLKTIYDGIVCGFCMPYLSEKDVETLIRDCYTLLSTGGVIYLSFVEGEPSQSGYQVSSSGSRIYFYCHQSALMNQLLTKTGFDMLQELEVNYNRTETDSEKHTIWLAVKR